MESLTATSAADVIQVTQPTTEPLNVMGQVCSVVVSLMIVIGVVGNVLVLTANRNNM